MNGGNFNGKFFVSLDKFAERMVAPSPRKFNLRYNLAKIFHTRDPLDDPTRGGIRVNIFFLKFQKRGELFTLWMCFKIINFFFRLRGYPVLFYSIQKYVYGFSFYQIYDFCQRTRVYFSKCFGEKFLYHQLREKFNTYSILKRIIYFLD